MKVYKVKCSKCGIERFTNEKAYDARLKRFGSIEEMEKKWVCRDCRKSTEVK